MNKWVKGLLASTIGGAANAGLLMFVDPAHVATPDGLLLLGKMAAGGAVIALLNYLKKSPIPEE